VPSKSRFDGEKKTRQQLERERRTAEYAAANPGSLVIRAQVATGLSRAASGTVQAIGLFMMRPRTVHLIANGSGVRAMQSRGEAEWDKPWREVVTITAVGNAPTLLELDAVGWHAPKLFQLCKPDGELQPPGEVSAVARRFNDYAALRE
jgi:hypothetical protein